MNKLYQLILIDKATGQPQKVESIEGGHLNMASPLQRELYVATINALSPNTSVTCEDNNEIITINLQKNIPSVNINTEQIIADIFEPEEESPSDTPVES